MGVSTFHQPDFTSQQATEYKTALDDSANVFKRLARAFAPHAQASPNMTVRVDPGHVYDGDTLTEVAAQDTDTITAPSVDDRIDRVVLSNTDGSVSVVTGSEAPEPTAPAIPDGYVPCARVYLKPSTTEITNAIITDERSRLPEGGEEAIVELGGDFDAGEKVRLVRRGDRVICMSVDGSLSHTSNDSPMSSLTAIPQSFRPETEVTNVYFMASNAIAEVRITSNGALRTFYRDWEGNGVETVGTIRPIIISYLLST